MVDYTIWDLRNEFNLGEISFLWCGVDPHDPVCSTEVEVRIRAMYDVLTEATARRKLKVEAINLDGTISTVSRKGLRVYAKKVKQRPLFLFPEDRRIGDEPKNVTEQAKGEKFKYTPDFRSIRKDGRDFRLSPKQAQIIEMLFNVQQEKIPDLSQAHIIEEVSPNTSTKRLREFFKKDPETWKGLIEPGYKKGTFRLKK